MTKKTIGDTIIDLMAAFELHDVRVTGIEVSESIVDALAFSYSFDMRRLAAGAHPVLAFNGAAVTVREPPLTPTQRAAQMLREMADKLDKEPS